MTQVDDSIEYEVLSKEEKHALQKWIATHMRGRKTINDGYTSYGLKHMFEDCEVGFYISNGQFKGAMIAAGFTPCNPNMRNHCYCISQKGVRQAELAAGWIKRY